MYNYLDTRTTSFGTLFNQGQIYRVPIFQRDYSWSEENWEDLWQDLQGLYQEADLIHYMGTIVLQSSPQTEQEFIIIDGQQRLVTLSIVIMAVIEKLKNLGNNRTEVRNNQKRQDIIKRIYLIDQNPYSLKYLSRLQLNESDNDFYQNYLITQQYPDNLEEFSKSNQLLWGAYEYFLEKLEMLPEVIKNSKNLIDFLTKIIAQRLIFIVIIVKDELKAYTIFETLNSRGMELSATDLIKNYLFSLPQNNEDLASAQQQWGKLINKLGMDTLPEFLRYYFNFQETRVRRDRLLKVVRESVQNIQQVFDLLEQLEYSSNLFISLGNHRDNFWHDSPHNRPYIHELEILQARQVYPLLSAAYYNFLAQEFTDLLKLICPIYLRYYISELNPNCFETLCNNVAIGITKGEINSTRQIFNCLQPIYINDEKFRQDFAIFSLPTTGKSKELALYLLGKLEVAISPKLLEEDFSLEYIDADSNRLGNLTILEYRLQQQCLGQPYPRKREIYQHSAYQLSQSINYPEWNLETINKRQQKLAETALKIWTYELT